MREHIAVTICDDCAIVTVNGTDDEPDKIAHMHRMVEHSDERAHVVVDLDSHVDFSTTPCGTCGTRLAGGRWTAEQEA